MKETSSVTFLKKLKIKQKPFKCFVLCSAEVALKLFLN